MQDATELKQFFRYQKAMLLMVGNNRSKQSGLLAKAISYSDPNHIVFRLKGKSTLTPTKLTDIISKHWAVRYSNTSACSWDKKFDYILDCLSTHNQTCLILIQQAHLLSADTLKALCYLSGQQTNDTARIRIVLSGYPELVSAVNAATDTPQDINVIDVNAKKNTTEKIYLAVLAYAQCQNHGSSGIMCQRFVVVENAYG